MRVALTGATGFVGAALLEQLATRGLRSVPLNRTRLDMPGEKVIGDLATAAIDPLHLRGTDVVVHLAALTHSPASQLPSIEDYRAVNVHGTVKLVEAAVTAGIKRFVYVSSIKAAAERSTPGRPIDSATTPIPEDGYGISKLEAEHEVRARCAAAGVEWVIVRPPLVYGPGAKGNFRRLIALAGKGWPLPLGSVRNRRSILYVENLADALVLACTEPGAKGQVLTLCDETLSTPELLRAVAAALDVRLRLLPMPVFPMVALGRLVGRGAELDRICGSLEIDPRESMRAIGWAPRHELRDALRRTVADAADHG